MKVPEMNSVTLTSMCVNTAMCESATLEPLHLSGKTDRWAL